MAQNCLQILRLQSVRIGQLLNLFQILNYQNNRVAHCPSSSSLGLILCHLMVLATVTFGTTSDKNTVNLYALLCKLVWLSLSWASHLNSFPYPFGQKQSKSRRSSSVAQLDPDGAGGPGKDSFWSEDEANTPSLTSESCVSATARPCH